MDRNRRRPAGNGSPRRGAVCRPPKKTTDNTSNNGPDNENIRERRIASPHPSSFGRFQPPHLRNKNPNGNARGENNTPSNSNSRLRRNDSQDSLVNERKSYNRRNDGRSNHSNRSMGFKYIENLLNENDIEHIITDLMDSRKGFTLLLDSPNISNDFIVLILRLLSKICESSFVSSATAVLRTAVTSKFVEKLNGFIALIPTQGQKNKQFNKYLWEDTDNVWYNILLVCEKVVELIPSTAAETLPSLLRALKYLLPIIEQIHAIHIADNIKEKVETLLEVVDNLAQKLEQEKTEKRYNRYDEEGPPPEDFREIPIYPTSKEITHEISPYLRPNIIKGPYNDVEHYLDIQFRLLREDFVKPLRESICAYLKNSKQRIENVRIYKGVQFLNTEVVNEQDCYRVKFDFNVNTKKHNFKELNSKRFMFGSLICFTCDNFANILFGKVADRDLEKCLKKGEIVVGFSDDQIGNIQIGKPYLMIECKIFFEPYFQVLKCLKRMIPEHFPMPQYMINVKSESIFPYYIRDVRDYRIENTMINPYAWPVGSKFWDLNESQENAFKAAVTQELAIIQGPPGTGKTFLGLKVAGTLLNNKGCWYDDSPMLVICYTNHALDQFLEGLLPYTDKLLRIGGQSKNERLSRFNIMSSRRHNQSAACREQKAKVSYINNRLASTVTTINNINQYNAIFDFLIFLPDKIRANKACPWNSPSSKWSDRLNWLFVLEEEENPNEFQANEFQIVTEQRRDENVEENAGEDDEDEESSSDEEEIQERDDIFDNILINNARTLLTQSQCNNAIHSIEAQIRLIQDAEELSELEKIGRIEKFHDELIDYNNKKFLMTRILLNAKNGTIEDINDNLLDFSDVNTIHPQDRWKLYFKWLNNYRQLLQQTIPILRREFKEEYKIYEELRNIDDVQIMKKKLVVGMTTTRAASLQSSLQALKSPIVIVEEAAEILEAHIVASISRYCQHLILIGDHQQLKPSTSDFRIETDYNLGISLFERLIINNVQCFTLNVQHRMRPEISCLITPTIYPSLQNHESVYDRPNINGVQKCVYFVDHNNPEDSCNDSSKKNVHEAKFFIAFARHLILNGYKAEQITILAAYLGQMFEMQREKNRNRGLLNAVRICCLDNFQGEENDIILLSLVRNNQERKVGFLKIENRICVALSRARNGLYVMGNMGMLTENSKIWKEVNETLIKQGSIGPELTLQCQIHNTLTNVKSAEDFQNVSEGGCNIVCDTLLNCGHNCVQICHILDREHKDYRCLKPCLKELCSNPEHLCKKECYQVCGRCMYPKRCRLDCGHEATMACSDDPEKFLCTVKVETTLLCGHQTMKNCHQDSNKIKCKVPCPIRVEPCGHACEMVCHVNNDPDHFTYKCKKECAKPREGCTMTKDEDKHICPKKCFEECVPCDVIVKKFRTTCPHVYQIECKKDVDSIICEKPCTKLLPCGHKCKSKCCEPCALCEKKVVKKVEGCGHVQKTICSKEAERKNCFGKCPRQLPCGHVCKEKCNQPCTTKCEELIDYSVKGACNHPIKFIKCHMKNSNEPTIPSDSPALLELCTEPCNTTLECGHKCLGSCGKCNQGRIHIRCSEKCGAVLICNHECPIPCRETCKPCMKKCSYKCVHSQCGQRCGAPCTPCNEPCIRKCKHAKCTRKCSQDCSIGPCKEPCDKILICGHPCVGFCGDPCPKLCRICNEDELTEIFFGTEDDEDARFVQLVDCGHVLESDGMEGWLNSLEDGVQIKGCPKCKTPITNTYRYIDYVRKSMRDVMEVKTRIVGKVQEILYEKKLLEDMVKTLFTIAKLRNLPIEEMCVALAERLSDKKGKHFLSKLELQGIRSLIQLLKEFQSISQNAQQTVMMKSCSNFDMIISTLKRCLLLQITNQEIDDLQLEIRRLKRMVELKEITESGKVSVNLADVVKWINIINKKLFSLERYSYDVDKSLVSDLKELSSLCKVTLAISEHERQEIVKALGMDKGRWFKCPNGHFYVIGECGGAMVTTKCSECDEQIGGSNHRLLTTNVFAPEMDGARYPAWSEAANLANYRFNP